MRVLGWAMGERHSKSKVAKYKNTIGVTFTPVPVTNYIDYFEHVLQEHSERQFDKMFLHSLFFKMEKIVKSDEWYSDTIRWVEYNNDNKFILYQSTDNDFIPQLPVYWSNFKSSKIGPAASEFYHHFSTIKTTFPQIEISEIILSMNVLNTSYHEFNLLQFPEAMKIYYRFYSVLCILSYENPQILAEILQYILPECFPDGESLAPIDVENEKNIIDQSFNPASNESYAEMKKLLSELSIWRFLQNDKDTFYLVDYLLNNTIN